MSYLGEMADERDDRIDYLEIKTRDLVASKEFFGALVGWAFTDFGDSYAAFNDGRLDGGFEVGEPGPGTLVVFYMDDLVAAKSRVLELGGQLTRDTFSFPGGHRFEFTDPGGAHFAIWSEAEATTGGENV